MVDIAHDDKGAQVRGGEVHVWRERLHLLEPGEKDFMEECVDLKLKERNTWRLVWEPDEYTVGWIERMKDIYWQKREKEEKDRVEMEKQEA